MGRSLPDLTTALADLQVPADLLPTPLPSALTLPPPPVWRGLLGPSPERGGLSTRQDELLSTLFSAADCHLFGHRPPGPPWWTILGDALLVSVLGRAEPGEGAAFEEAIRQVLLSSLPPPEALTPAERLELWQVQRLPLWQVLLQTWAREAAIPQETWTPWARGAAILEQWERAICLQQSPPQPPPPSSELKPLLQEAGALMAGAPPALCLALRPPVTP